jgi:hypothetical protein
MTDQTRGHPEPGPGRYRFSDVFSRSFAVFRQQPPLFVAMVLFVTVVTVILQAIMPNLPIPTPPASVFDALGFWLVMAQHAASGVIEFLIQAFVILLSVRAMRDGRAEFGITLARMGRRLLPLIGTSLVLFLAAVACVLAVAVPSGAGAALLGVGSGAAGGAAHIIGILLAIPALILLSIGWVMMAAAIPACLNEDLGVVATLRRSAGLTKGSRWLIFASFLVLYVVTGIISFAWESLSTSLGGSVFAVYLIAPATALTDTFSSAFNASIYHELRLVKDGAATNRLSEVFT